ncbi:response regulator [Amylibacter sp. SFDW26]|uniref:response regulator transcription factor n=1 Tax=Amylibacter sp. SFDW26 TaxID=2652722 RepID=UPI001262479A|nr:response regulator [Amylibacter sp. SFDW26]KAB7614702.1 response regulator [Amylibacter sp. SFDW26]
MAKSVLLVEDEPFIIEALSFLLTREGLNVSAFMDGDGCVEHIQKTNPDLIVLDMMLPNKSGMQILEELRAIEGFADLPVLMLTAKGQKKDRTAAEEAGVSLFMTKPFSNKEIIRNIHTLLSA